MAKIVFFAAKQIVIYKRINCQIFIFKPDHLLVVVISLNPSSEKQEQYLLTRVIMAKTHFGRKELYYFMVTKSFLKTMI